MATRPDPGGPRALLPAAGERADLPRIILLGASNLTRGLATVLGILRASHGPCEVLVAAGHGRSYGRPSRVLARGLVGILDSGLWRAAASPGRPARALLTDIGNDLAYGSPAAEVEAWVAACVHRLRELGATAGLTLPPLASLSRLRRWQFRLVKAILFPGRPLGYREAQARAAELAGRLAALARREGAHLCEPRREWYGFDGIHLRAGCRQEAWSEILAACGLAGANASGAALDLPRWRPLTPERQSILGRERTRAQPSRALGDGTRISFF